MNIIETIGEWGVKTTPARVIHTRLTNPRVGDPVDFGAFQGVYPFTQGQFGRIASIGESGGYSVICEPGRVFLCENASASISGGPFTFVEGDWISPAFETKLVMFWNWGDLGQGAGNGVEYWIERPLFRLVKFGVRTNWEKDKQEPAYEWAKPRHA